MQQRVGVAATLLADPRIVILDEPSVGLDPGQSLAFRGLVRELGSTRLVILSSHLLSEVESVCSELAIVAGGRVVAHESIDRFRARAAQDGRMFAEIDRALAGDPALAQLFGECAEQRLEDGWHRIEFRGAAGDDPRARIAGDLSARGVRLRALGVASASLESVFVGLVHAAAADTATSDTATSGTAGGGR
jgi:ABC-2 type transport system ATP-binding protein